MWSLLLFLSTLHVVNASCPPDWDLARNGECRGFYQFYMGLPDDDMNDRPAQLCKEIDAIPVIIHDDEDQLYWRALANDHAWLILALVCNAKTKKWEWDDGSAVDYKPAQYDSELNNTNCSSKCTWYMDGWNGGNLGWKYDCDQMIHWDWFYCAKQLPPLPVPSADGCDNFEYDNDDGVCYQIGATADNFKDAQLICRNLGASLASIHNSQENAFIRRLAVSKGAVHGLFLGGTSSGNGNNFEWIDGSEWDYDDFVPGFPIPGLGDCMAMDTSTSTGQWMNVDCNAKLPVACIREEKAVADPVCSTDPWKEGAVITSPGFPYSAYTPCDYYLTVEAGKRVEVELNFLEANSCCDFLTFFDGYIGGYVLANVTGAVNNTTYTTTTSNVMRVSWQPNGAVNVRGFALTFRGV